MSFQQIHILHIANSYGGSKVYTNLITELDKLGVKQTVFVPLNPNNHNRIGQNLIDFSVFGSKIIYSTSLKKYHRYFYEGKIRTIKNEIEEKVNLKSVTLIQAGLFTSDGAVAYELSKIYNIPYIVSVRDTDINVYYKIMWWKRTYFHSIIENSGKVVFISPQYKNTFMSLMKRKNVSNVDGKSIVVPNGVDKFYLNNRVQTPRNLHSPIRIVFAGAFNKRKNIVQVIYALDELITRGRQVSFFVIGAGLKFRKESESYVRKINTLAETRSWVKILNSMPKEELRVYFEKSDIFVMPSTTETFGLVYVEALSQGLPIIFSKGQGFDGYYNDMNIGCGVDPSDSKNIADMIEYLVNNYSQISYNVSKLNLNKDFSWGKIARRYLEIYSEII